ncbi:Zinc finger protein [Actinidia chinensis var. chinensis]|uniref:Zinc finger protein n=1 Tax=Actinidia chinensis var. chinensis TaxID=1590841 RepID=A0A2R6QP79_ACTCC|nr:Zinc finger protein [Actinidia chinensis var. chinensis]
METEISELIVALEKATLMAKQIPAATTDPSQIIQIYATLHAAHYHLSSFLAHTSQPLPQPSLLRGNSDEYMQFGDEEVQNSTAAMDGVEEGMKDCFIQNKRLKRPLSPVAAAAVERRRSCEDELVKGSGAVEFEPQGTRLRALDLIYQFHG